MNRVKGDDDLESVIDKYRWEKHKEFVKPAFGKGCIMDIPGFILSSFGIGDGGNPQIQFRTMIRLKLHDYVDVILTPRTIAEVKPSNFLFEKAMTIFDVEPQGVVMIGDSFSADMVGAMNAGIVPIWLNMSGNDNPEGGCVAEVSSLRELVDLIQRGDDSDE